MNNTLEPFSEGYFMVTGPKIIEHSGDDVIAPLDLTEWLARYSRVLIFKLGNRHYHTEPQRAVPSDTVAIPRNTPVPEDAPLLLARDGRMMEIMMDDGEFIDE